MTLRLDLQSVGCYKDGYPQRDFEVQMKSHFAYTPALCVKQCFERGFLYAGVQAGKECFCSATSERKYGLLSSEKCIQRCDLDQTLTCGGNLVNDVYRTTRIQHVVDPLLLREIAFKEMNHPASSLYCIGESHNG